MKIGETFIDGNRKFEVVGFASGYPVSKYIGEQPTQIEIFTSEKEEKAEVTTPDVNYEDMQYAQLKKLCAEKGLSAKGSKQDLVDRLRG